MSLLRQRHRHPPHDSTPTSRANRQIEKALSRDLNRIVNAIRHELPDYRISKSSELEARIKPLLRTSISSTLRKHMTDSYVQGINYVTSLPGFSGILGYLTSSDLEIIKGLVDSYSTRFWGRTERALTNTISLEHLNKPEAQLLNPNYIVNTLAIGATNEALNQATIQKARVLTTNAIKSKSNVGIAQEFDEFEFPDLPLDLELVAVWVTSMDELVCPICEELEGDYSFDEEIPQPVEDSHPNCRCRIIIEGA
jgi:hypothetical protein